MRVHTDWLLTPERAAVHLRTATAVVSDLHLGYTQARGRRGEALPDFGLAETVAALESLQARYGVRRLVFAGDLLEDGRCIEALAEFLAWLTEAGIELAAIIPGNHDAAVPTIPGELAFFPKGIELQGWRVVHGDAIPPRGKVIHGHFHPCLRWGGKIAAPCYLVGRNQIVLPAFSPHAAGVNILRDSRWCSFRCGVIAGDRVLDFGRVDRLRRRRYAKK